jgi:hypothetical protein
MFKLNIQGELGTVLPSELNEPNKPFGKAWNNFLRELDACGATITDAKIENAGKTINLPVRATAVHA